MAEQSDGTRGAGMPRIDRKTIEDHKALSAGTPGTKCNKNKTSDGEKSPTTVLLPLPDQTEAVFETEAVLKTKNNDNDSINNNNNHSPPKVRRITNPQSDNNNEAPWSLATNDSKPLALHQLECVHNITTTIKSIFDNLGSIHNDNAKEKAIDIAHLLAQAIPTITGPELGGNKNRNEPPISSDDETVSSTDTEDSTKENSNQQNSDKDEIIEQPNKDEPESEQSSEEAEHDEEQVEYDEEQVEYDEDKELVDDEELPEEEQRELNLMTWWCTGKRDGEPRMAFKMTAKTPLREELKRRHEKAEFYFYLPHKKWYYGDWGPIYYDQFVPKKPKTNNGDETTSKPLSE